jgi:hypothetical protein
VKIDQSLEGKKVKILHENGKIFTGTVLDYIYPDDNEPEGIAGLLIDDCPQVSYLLRINENEIQSVKIVD